MSHRRCPTPDPPRYTDLELRSKIVLAIEAIECGESDTALEILFDLELAQILPAAQGDQA